MTLRAVVVAVGLALGLAGVPTACGAEASDERAAPRTTRGATTADQVESTGEGGTTTNRDADRESVIPDVTVERDLGDVIDRLRKRRSRPDERLAAAVRRMTNRDLDVHCWPPRPWARVAQIVAGGDLRLAGTVDPIEYKIDIAGDVCDALRALDAGNRILLTAEAVYILAHEAGHFTRGSNESNASCYGIQRVDDLAVELGMSESEARELAELAWEAIYPAQPDDYKADQCRPGGVLDDDPDDPEWP